mmetsp:Transcript_96877/g.172427  ORF Transcript_96877/g.172427 Transcript_96877/m.172427 type:complete len:218 (-) Transcript_96877:1506-2159(-)
MLNLKTSPNLPKLLLLSGIAELGGVDIDAASSIHLAKHGFHLGIAHARILDAILRQGFNSLVVDFARPGLTEELSCFPKKDAVHLEHVLLLYRRGCSVVNGECMPGKAVLLLEPCVEHVKPPCKFWWHLLQCLFKEIPRTLELSATISLHELSEVSEPNVVHVRPIEDLDATFVDFESILEVFPILQKLGIAEDQSRCSHLQFQRGIVCCSGGLRGA